MPLFVVKASPVPKVGRKTQKQKIKQKKTARLQLIKFARRPKENMQKFLRNWQLIFGLMFVFALVSIAPVNASSVAAPTVLKINSFKAYSLMAPVISGVTPKDTSVLVYIDDIFAGSAKTKSEGNVSDSFYFQAFKLSTGVHSVYLVAEDKVSLVRSERSTKFDIVVNDLPAPTLVVPNENTVTEKVKPLIEGFTISGSFVHVYIDGIYNGKTEIKEHVSGTAHFSYLPFLNLSVGKHQIWTVSEDIGGRKSVNSKIVEFTIDDRMPAPTIYEPVVNNNTSYDQPYIVGLAKNDSKIRVFIDHKVAGEFQVDKHDSGTANFAYKPSTALSVGEHIVYTTAIDQRGKESLWSNIVYFEIVQPSVAMISEVAAEEEVIITEESIVSTETEIVEEVEKNDNKNSETITEDDADDESLDLEEVLNVDKATDTEAISGPIDESKKQQGKLGWNAIVFMLFLVSVIAWIFWVNRELIKEKKEQEESKK